MGEKRDPRVDEVWRNREGREAKVKAVRFIPPESENLCLVTYRYLAKKVPSRRGRNRTICVEVLLSDFVDKFEFVR